jgi:hypothetical protein
MGWDGSIYLAVGAISIILLCRKDLGGLFKGRKTKVGKTSIFS